LFLMCSPTGHHNVCQWHRVAAVIPSSTTQFKKDQRHDTHNKAVKIRGPQRRAMKRLSFYRCPTSHSLTNDDATLPPHSSAASDNVHRVFNLNNPHGGALTIRAQAAHHWATLYPSGLVQQRSPLHFFNCYLVSITQAEDDCYEFQMHMHGPLYTTPGPGQLRLAVPVQRC